MFKGLAKTDLAALFSAMGVSDALQLVADDRALKAQILRTENAIKAIDPRRFATIQTKSRQLADFMRTGHHGTNLLRNAHAIAHLFGETGARATQQPEPLVSQIDQLVTLYAIQDLGDYTKDTLRDLMKNETEGLEFVLSYLVGQRKDELSKVVGDAARLNHYKGHIPSEPRQEGHLIIANASEHARLRLLGYEKVADYAGSSADRSFQKRAYYFRPVSGRAPFRQGVLQTVHQTVSGVDPRTGYTVGEVMGGRIEDPRMVKNTRQQLANQRQTAENLLPVWDSTGDVIAYERAADPARLAILGRSTDLAAMIGVWRGRQMEEMLSQEVNDALVERLQEIWERDRKKGKKGEFINLFDPAELTDPVVAEAVKLIPRSTREHIRDAYGAEGVFMVRKDMLLDVIGDRQASVGDMFTGENRWNPKVVEKFKDLALGIFGENAYRKLVNTEQLTQDVVANMKDMIVIKSVIVPAANMVSNLVQLLNRGVPLRKILRGVPAKLVEINDFVRRRDLQVKLEADLRAAEAKGDIITARKIENQITSIKDSYRRMSIWPLIVAGEFSTISDGRPTVEDLSIANGKWSQYVEGTIAKLPEGLRTPVRYALITRDTALFQGLARSVQYGDFIAKAILYDDLTARQQMDRKEAVATVNEAFVNYNRLAGRGRQYLESVGLLWFPNYKLRIMKEAAWTLRNRPLNAFLMMFMPSLPVIGNVRRQG